MKTLIKLVLMILAAVLFIGTGTASAAPKSWTGNVSTAWTNPANWNPAGVPNASSDVTIPGGRPNYPVITADVYMKKLTIRNGATVSTIGSPNIFAFGGVDIQSGGTLTLGSGSLTSQGDLKNAGTLNAGSGFVTTTKNFINSGTFNAGTSTFVMAGNNATISGNNVTFYNLMILKKTDSSVNIVVLNDLVVTTGKSLTMGNRTLTVIGNIGGGGTVTAKAPFISAVNVVSSTQLDVDFSETVSLATSQALANYAIDNGVTISSATRDGSDNSIVHLTVSPVSNGIEYTMTVSNVQDAGGTSIAAGTQKKFTPTSVVTYQIAATAGDGGTITPSGVVIVTEAANQGFTITPHPIFHIDSVVVDGVNQGAVTSYNFTNVTANHEIEAYFSVNVQTITATASAGGSITPNGSVVVAVGTDTSFSIAANVGYHIDSVVVDGVNQGAVSTYGFIEVTGPHSIAAYFSSDILTITASASAGGTISPDGALNLNYGSDQEYTLFPDANFHVDSVLVDGVNQGAVASYSFTNVTTNHTIDAYFSIDQVTITASASAGGTITPDGAVGVDYGSDQAFSIAANLGFTLDSVVVDGVNQGAVTSHNFTNVTAAHSISAFFSTTGFTIIASASAGGSITPDGAIGVVFGSDQDFTIAPNTGHHIDSVVVDGANLGAVTNYDFTNVTANHSIDAWFSPDVMTITASASAGGSITPNGGVGVNYGSDQAFSIAPDTGYQVDSVVVDGVNQGAVASFNFTNVTENHTIDAWFSPEVLTVSASASAGGSISPSGPVGVTYGSDQAFSITPDANHHIDSVLVDGVNQGAVASVNFTNVTAGHTVEAWFSLDVFTITPSASAGGSITPGGPVGVLYGSDQFFSIDANTGYHVDSVLVDGVNQGAVTSFNFTNVTAPHAIDAWFSLDVLTVSASASAGGSITPNGGVGVNYGSDQAFSITPDANHHLDSVLVDGVNQGVVTNFNFTNVTENHTIDAWFSIDVMTITATASAGGTITPGGAVGVNYGSDQGFSIAPNLGYTLDSVVVDGVDQGAVTNFNFTNVTAPHSIAAYFSTTGIPITATASAGGTITPNGAIGVTFGSDQAYSIAPNAGHHIDSVVVDGVNQGAVTSFNFTNVTASHSIDAWFSPDVMTITASASAGGSITPGGPVGVNYGSGQAFSIVPDADHHIDSVVVDGVNQGAVTSFTFTNVTAPHAIDAWFSGDAQAITATASAGGTITPSGTVGVGYGSDQAFSIAPGTGHHIDSVLVDGVNQGAVTDYDFTNVTSGHTIGAWFSPDVMTITASASAGGTITPGGAVGVNYGSDQGFSIAPNLGYTLDSVVVDGVDQGAVTGFNFTNVTAAHSIEAYFSTTGIPITATASAGGTITPNGAVGVTFGGDQAYSIAPNAGHHIDSVLVDGVNQGAVTGFNFTNVTASHEIAAYFSADLFAVAGVAGANGTVTPAGVSTVAYGDAIAYAIVANAGYFIADVHVDSVSVGAMANYTFTNVSANHLISATFARQAFTVTALAGSNGSVNPAGPNTVYYGDTLTVTITPAAGYFVSDVHVDSVSVGAAASYTFTGVSANHLLTADFALNAYPVTALAGPNGSVTPAGTTPVGHGGNLTVNITPAAGYFISDVHVDSVSVGPVSSYDFTNVTGSHLLTASFALKSYSVTALAGPNGSVTPAGLSTINHGSSLTVNITPASGYFVSDVHVDSVSVGSVTSYSFNNVAADHLLEAFFSTNVPPAAVQLLSPADLDTLLTTDLGAVPFVWSTSSDPDSGDTLSYTLTITGPSVNITAGGLSDTTTTLDLSSDLSAGVTYQWSVSVNDGEATVHSSGPFSFFVDSPTGVDEAGGVPKVYALTQNYPNPFNPATTIRFDLPERSEVVLTVFNLLGARVMEIYGGEELSAGTYQETVDFSTLSSGAYFYRLEARGVNGVLFTQVRKMVLLK